MSKKTQNLPTLKINTLKSKEDSKKTPDDIDTKHKTHNTIETIVEETASDIEVKSKKEDEKKDVDSKYSHSRSTFPDVLDQYGKKEKKVKFEEKRKKVKRKSKKTSVFYDSDEEKEKEKERDDEKYLQVLDDLKKLRKYYYNEYKELLTEKVEQQRRHIKRQKEKLENEVKKKEKMQRDASHRVRKRSDHHVLAHDDEYLKDIPKSDVYMIIGLQDKMIKEGKLKTQADFDDFWLEMKKPEIFFSYFPEGISSVSFGNIPAKSSTASTKRATTPGMAPRSLSNITETKESSRPNTQEDAWAVTQQFKHVHSAERASGKSTKLSKLAASDLEMKCPKLEMPPLHCFRMDLGKQTMDPEEVRRKAELRIKEKHRRGFLKKLHKMHHLAMANRAAATSDLKRLGILDQNKYLSFLMEGPELTDIIADYYWGFSRPEVSPSIEIQTPPSETQEETSRPILLPLITDLRGHSAPEHKTEERLSGSPHEKRKMIIARTNEIADLRGYSAPADQFEVTEHPAISEQPNVSAWSRRKSVDLDSGKQLVPYTPVKPLPLSVNDIMGKSKTMKPKCLSTVWINYLRAENPLSLTS